MSNFLQLLYSYRSFANDHTTKIAEGIIDGDLIEQFLELSQNDMAEICKGIKVVMRTCKKSIESGVL